MVEDLGKDLAAVSHASNLSGLGAGSPHRGQMEEPRLAADPTKEKPMPTSEPLMQDPRSSKGAPVRTPIRAAVAASNERKRGSATRYSKPSVDE